MSSPGARGFNRGARGVQVNPLNPLSVSPRCGTLQRCHAAVNADGVRLSSADPEWAARTAFGLGGTELPCHVCASTPGDVILFRHSLFHSVYYHRDGRAVLASKFAARPTTSRHHASTMRCAGRSSFLIPSAPLHSAPFHLTAGVSADLRCCRAHHHGSLDSKHYEPSELFLRHSDPAIRAMCAECGNVEARAAAIEAMINVDWEALAEKQVYGPDVQPRL